jgi:Fe-S-cluster containining protein
MARTTPHKTFNGIKLTPENKCGFCSGAICCTYVTQEVDAPTTVYDYDIWLWMLYHQDVQFYKEDGDWYLKILNRCNHLQPDGRCGIYETRPIICREHENDFCEFDVATEEDADIFFGTPEDLEKYCRKKFKNWDKRYDKYNRQAEKKMQEKLKKEEKKKNRENKKNKDKK